MDHLTGAMTRRGFAVEMEKAIARFTADQRPSALVLLDIDHFKRINDTYGHPSGDVVLKQVSECLTAMLRQHDVLGRLGGEEFGILLRDATLAGAENAAERFRAALESLEIDHDPPLPVTASFGVAGIRGENASTAQWLAAADEALYAAKRSGRNRCCTARQGEAEWVDRRVVNTAPIV